MPEKPFEDGVDVVGSAENPFDSAASAAESDHDEVADGCIAGALPVDRDRDAALEEGLADEELPAAGELRDESGPRGQALNCSSSARWAARSASSRRVSGSSNARTFGTTPWPVRFWFDGVR